MPQRAQQLASNTLRRAPEGTLRGVPVWVTEVAGLDSPHAAHVTRTRHDGYDRDGQLISKEIVHAVSSLSPGRNSPAGLAAIARGQWGIESVHWLRDTTWQKTRTRPTRARD